MLNFPASRQGTSVHTDRNLRPPLGRQHLSTPALSLSSSCAAKRGQAASTRKYKPDLNECTGHCVFALTSVDSRPEQITQATSTGTAYKIVAMASSLHRWCIAACLLMLTLCSHAQVQLLNITSQLAPSLSSTCLSVLNQQLACNATLAGLGRSQGLRIYSDQFLAGLCTSGCASALSTWLRRVSGACGSSHMPLDTSNQTQVIPAYFVETYLEAYQQTCLPGA